jgi:hypothetical protein
MQLPPPNNFSIAKNRPAYSDQRQGISGRAYKRLSDNLHYDPTQVNFPNFQARVDYYLAKLKFDVLPIIQSGESVNDYLYELERQINKEILLIIKVLNDKQTPAIESRNQELRRYQAEVFDLQNELLFIKPAKQEQYIIDLIEKYTELRKLSERWQQDLNG